MEKREKEEEQTNLVRATVESIFDRPELSSREGRRREGREREVGAERDRGWREGRQGENE